MNPKRPDRDEFEDYLQSESTLSRAYKETAKQRPPVELDTRILERARQAVRGEARVARSPFASNWMIPASLAVVLVLTVGLVTFIFEETDTPVSPETLPAPSRDSLLEEESSLSRDKARQADDALRFDEPADEKAKAKRGLATEPPAAAAPTVEGLTKTRRQSQKSGEMKQIVPAKPEAAETSNAASERWAGATGSRVALAAWSSSQNNSSRQASTMCHCT